MGWRGNIKYSSLVLQFLWERTAHKFSSFFCVGEVKGKHRLYVLTRMALTLGAGEMVCLLYVMIKYMYIVKSYLGSSLSSINKLWWGSELMTCVECKARVTGVPSKQHGMSHDDASQDCRKRLKLTHGPMRGYRLSHTHKGTVFWCI